MDCLEERFQHRLALERIVSRIARNFVMLENPTDSINHALEEIGKYSRASRAYIFEFQEDGIFMNNTYEWCREGVASEMARLQNQKINSFPWWMAQIKEGDILNIKDVSKLGDEAQAEREILELQSVKSALIMPLMQRGILNGFVGFDNVDATGNWHDEDMTVLSIAAEFFSSVFNRLAAEKEIHNAKKELEVSLESLQHLQAQLIQQEQLVAIGQLAAGVAHEINNPLGFVMSNQKTLQNYANILKGYAEYCLERNEKPALSDSDRKELTYIVEDLDDVFSDINEGLVRVKKIIKSMRIFSRIDRMTDYEPYDVKEGIENTLVIIKSRLSGLGALKLNIDTPIPMIQAYGGKINQVLLNLIVNALDAIKEAHPNSPGEGCLEISTRTKRNKNERKIVEIQIVDNGIGMTDEVKNKLFMPFYTTKKIGKGTGLGMSIVYDIVKNSHAGEIIVESTEGVGTSITVQLPVNS